jgi:hypothetical protein
MGNGDVLLIRERIPLIQYIGYLDLIQQEIEAGEDGNPDCVECGLNGTFSLAYQFSLLFDKNCIEGAT